MLIITREKWKNQKKKKSKEIFQNKIERNDLKFFLNKAVKFCHIVR